MIRKRNMLQRIMVGFFALALCLLSGCSADDALLPEPPQDENKKATTLKLIASIADDVATRALTKKEKFKLGDYIGISIYKRGTNTILNDYKNLRAQVTSQTWDENLDVTCLSISPRITEDADIVAYYPYDDTGRYTDVPATGSFPYIAKATATTNDGRIELHFTLNVAKLEITLIACPRFEGFKEWYPQHYNYVFSRVVYDDEITEYSKNKGGWYVHKVEKYLYAGHYKGRPFSANRIYCTPEKDKTFEAGKIYKYNYNFTTKEENSNLITSIEDFQKIEKGKKYSQINDLTSPDGKLWQANVELEKGAYNGNGFLVQDYKDFLFLKADLSEIQNVYMNHTIDNVKTYGLVKTMVDGTISGCKRTRSAFGNHINNYEHEDGSNAALAHGLYGTKLTATVLDVKYREYVEAPLSGYDVLRNAFCMANVITNACRFNEVYTSTIYAQNPLTTNAGAHGADPGNGTICGWRKTASGNKSTEDHNKNSRYMDIINGVYDGRNPYYDGNKMYQNDQKQGYGVEKQHLRFARWYAQWEFVRTEFGPDYNKSPWPNHYKIRTFTNSYWATGNENRQFVHNKANGKSTIVCDWETFENDYFKIGAGYEDDDSKFTQKPKLWWEVAPSEEPEASPPQLEHY